MNVVVVRGRRGKGPRGKAARARKRTGASSAPEPWTDRDIDGHPDPQRRQVPMRASLCTSTEGLNR
jgi:hypothetical protein